MNSDPVDGTNERIQRDGSWCVEEFAIQPDAFQFWNRFDGRWILEAFNESCPGGREGRASRLAAAHIFQHFRREFVEIPVLLHIVSPFNQDSQTISS